MESMLEQAIGLLLIALNVEPSDPNFSDTPKRAAEWFASFMPTKTTLNEILSPVFPEAHDELVSVTNIAFVSICAHHLLPFTGKAHIAYLPKGGVVGISKLARAVDFFAHRITLQERVTKDLADGITEVLKPMGVMVVMEATHDCMGLRGVLQPGAVTRTSAVRGVFRKNEDGIKDEFLQLIRGRTE